MKKGFLEGYDTYDPKDGYGNPKEWRDAWYQRMSRDDAEAILKDEPQTPHYILGISLEATPEDIKRAFRKRIVEWHPDRNQHRIPEAEEMSKKIIAAYTLLTD